ncbi:BCCT family transporter [Pseudonocardia sp. KRD-184]|uniref:BCCT family transporter n=1 Tax=Pseudonocardia oceani TaxID=2792013 RepID=A0ABS6UET3_9PSEU|nr:BCCT family transporter [Pseudonocardia oceani]MBW0090419.1 BCCT family transporter [Pseudonocardia oceani]MBW0097854.1 BCCT family transporter [Pseudonocardia oceani]MBW0110355.1 BCCT family transporter [Pseudonocardia oceani]MBW0124488.1 BCCT family transporter [Pseudonocardia oceani]MBW0130742.1 BCCT family transporter [Pseudonocardia oceani]
MTIQESPRNEEPVSDGPVPEIPATAAADQRHPVDRVVFGVAAVLMLAFIVWGAASTETLSAVASSVLDGIMNAGGWAFVLAASGFVVFALYLAFSRFGKIPLGRDDEGPEFRTVSWIAMMFSAGMGIGLMFYGVSEPLSHFTSPPPGTVAVGDPAALDVAMATTLFHWTLHPWAIYAVVGLAIAYSTFRRGRRQLISSAFAPLLGERRTDGPLGKAIDILAIFATLFGSAASLGLGALQIGAGLQLNGVPVEGKLLLVLIIGILTLAFVCSAVTGVAKGIQWLSNINMVLAGVLAVVVFIGGPTILILNLLPTAIGDYAGNLSEMASRTAANGGDATAEWLAGWTVFYWAWWISWTPFVGMFIARISRGRSIRQFITGVILIPSAVSLVWFAIFGGAAIDQQRTVDPTGATGLASQSTEGQLFGLLGSMPGGAILSVLAMVLIAIFFVSGADAASVVMGTLSSRGSIEPSRWVVIFWGVVMGAIAIIMLLVSPGSEALTGIQNITIIMAAPFALVMVALCVALTKDLRHDPLMRRDVRSQEAVEQAVEYGTRTYGDDFHLSVKQVKD